MSLPASIPLRRDSSDGVGSINADFSGFAAMGVVVLVVLFAFVWWRKRHQGNSSGQGVARSFTGFKAWGRWLSTPIVNQIITLNSARLTAKHSLHEVQWQGKRLLIGCSERSICLLAEVIPTPDGKSAITPDAAPVTNETIQ